jgi:hypothetical protein
MGGRELVAHVEPSALSCPKVNISTVDSIFDSTSLPPFSIDYPFFGRKPDGSPDVSAKASRVEGEKCQCRKARMQRNHVACAILVWLRLKAVAKEAACTMYQVKRRWLSEHSMGQYSEVSGLT